MGWAVRHSLAAAGRVALAGSRGGVSPALRSLCRTAA
ncbi:hypothetical protein J2Z33_001513 [Rubellimicrobium aerolatum]|nr:hypothetical protein [Rubellimicrobium aerolatum]